jgi:hypothetical protein
MSTDYNVWAWDASATPLNNATADGQVNWSEGQDPATVNNSARAMMTAFARYLDATSGGGGAFAVAGTADAITITTGQTISSGHQALGFRICFKAASTNTGAATVAVDALSPVAIKRPNGDALSAGDIVSGAFHDIAFDGTNYRLFVPGAGGNYGALSGNNTWTGANGFNGATALGDSVSDIVSIKGTTINSFSSGMLSNSSASAWRTDLGLATGTSGATVPLLNGANTWSAAQAISTTVAGGVSLAATVNTHLSTPIATYFSSATAGNFLYHTQHYAYNPGSGLVAFCGGIRGTVGLNAIELFSPSDRRLKDNIHDLDDAGDVIDRIQPRRFTWKGTTVQDAGFVADELQDVIPGMVDGERDGDRMQAIAPAKLIPYLVAEIKALRARVAALEAAA